MADSVTYGQLMKFLRKAGFVAKGKRQNRYKGYFKGHARTLTVHYHKDNDQVSSGLLSQYARELDVSKTELVDMIKVR